MFVNKNNLGVKVTYDGIADLRRMLGELARYEVLVGFPEETTARSDETAATGPITHASLGYIHDNGAPEANIPARPFMVPGIISAREKVADLLAATARKALNGGTALDIQLGYTRVGVIAQAALRMKINEGIPPPLAEATLEDRARRGRKGAKQELLNRSKGLPPSTQLAKPLIDTGQLRNAVNYVIRDRKKRST